MKKTLLLLLVCALALSACGQAETPETPAETAEPTEAPAETPEPAPTEEPEEVIPPVLILDNCEIAEQEGVRLEVTGFDEGAISFKLQNDGQSAWSCEGYSLKVKLNGSWEPLPLPESAAREALSVEPGHSLSGTLTPGGVEFDAGEYLFCLGELETAFTLVYTE